MRLGFIIALKHIISIANITYKFYITHSTLKSIEKLRIKNDFFERFSQAINKHAFLLCGMPELK